MCVCECVHARVYVYCVCVCSCVRAYMFIVCVCVCVCKCVLWTYGLSFWDSPERPVDCDGALGSQSECCIRLALSESERQDRIIEWRQEQLKSERERERW